MTSSNEHLLVFDIQRFSLHDGPGIRTTLFLKGCPLRCVWCQNPESQKPKPEIAFYAESCRQGFDCAAACTEAAILREEGSRVDYSKCNACGECAAACIHRGLRLIGQRWEGAALLDEVLKDRDYFADSGGGITLSGGEPMMQARSLAAWLPHVKQHAIHINLETSGLFRWEQMKRVLPYVDMIYFDLKHMDSQRHKQYTGSANELILENFARLAAQPVTLQARMPLIPNINTDAANLTATARFLRMHGHETIHCLPYHNLGEAKIPRIDTHLKLLHLERLTASDLDAVKQAFEKEGIHAVIYD